MDLNKFDEPFCPEDIEWRIQQSGKTRDGKVWAMVLAYVTNRAIMKRLDDVCGKAGWRNEYRDIPNNGGVECGISIRIDSEWVTKWDAAENTQVEAVKGGRSGAMKR
ncbi:TPA: recombinase, partial [Escherichia coli]|nr:recombinase [Escherichia coli]